MPQPGERIGTPLSHTLWLIGAYGLVVGTPSLFSIYRAVFGDAGLLSLVVEISDDFDAFCTRLLSPVELLVVQPLIAFARHTLSVQLSIHDSWQHLFLLFLILPLALVRTLPLAVRMRSRQDWLKLAGIGLCGAGISLLLALTLCVLMESLPRSVFLILLYGPVIVLYGFGIRMMIRTRRDARFWPMAAVALLLAVILFSPLILAWAVLPRDGAHLFIVMLYILFLSAMLAFAKVKNTPEKPLMRALGYSALSGFLGALLLVSANLIATAAGPHMPV